MRIRPMMRLARPAVVALVLATVPCAAAIFADGFESGDTGAWSAMVP